MPGYTGYIPGVYAENLYGKGYSKCAAKSLNRKIQRGADVSPVERFKTQN